MTFMLATDSLRAGLILLMFIESLFILLVYVASLSIKLVRIRRIILLVSFFVEYYLYSKFMIAHKAIINGKDLSDYQEVLQIQIWQILAIIVFITIINVYYTSRSVLWWKKHISASAVKQALDGLKTGVCYYDNNGKLLLANHKMNDISVELFEKNISTGSELEHNIGKEFPCTVRVGDKTYEFCKTIVNLEGVPVFELRANDISEEFEKNEQLKSNIEEQMKMGKRIRTYGKNVDKIAREEEILAAKINVHDELGQTLIRAKHYLETGEDENSSEIFMLWHRALALLRNEGNIATEEGNPSIAKDNDRYNNLLNAAKDVGIEVSLKGRVPADKTAFDVFIKALHTSITNAMKHADSENLYIDAKETISDYFFFFTNDGKMPPADFSEGGGLSHLREYVEKNGGTMKILIEPPKATNTGFTLSVKMPKMLVR